jgi:hypothetical protein
MIYLKRRNVFIFQKIYFRLAKGEIKVKSIIAVTGADILFITGQHTPVRRSNELSNYIKRGSQVLSPEEARKIAEIKLSSSIIPVISKIKKSLCFFVWIS